MISRVARILIVTLAGLALTLTACARSEQDQAVASGATKVTAEQLQTRLLGNTLSGHSTADGRVTHSHFSKDGSLRGMVASRFDTGRYRIDGNGRLCITYAYFTNGEELCHEVLQKDEKYTLFDSEGKQLAELTARPGDPEKLMEQTATP